MNTTQEIVGEVEARLNYIEQQLSQTKKGEQLLIEIPGIEPFHITKCSEIVGSLEKIMTSGSGNPSPQLAYAWEVVKLLNDNKEYIDEARHNDENWVAAVIERFNEKLKKNPAGFYTFAKAFKLVADLTRQKAQPEASEKSFKPEENCQCQQVKEFMAQLKNVFQPEDEDGYINPTGEFDDEWQTPISMFPQKLDYAEKTQKRKKMVMLIIPRKKKNEKSKRKNEGDINDYTSIVEAKAIESIEYVRSQGYEVKNNGDGNIHSNNAENKNIAPCVEVKPSIEKPATDLGELIRRNEERATDGLSSSSWKRHYNPLNCNIKEKDGTRICKEGKKQVDCANVVKSLDGRTYACSVPRGKVY